MDAESIVNSLNSRKQWTYRYSDLKPGDIVIMKENLYGYYVLNTDLTANAYYNNDSEFLAEKVVPCDVHPSSSIKLHTAVCFGFIIDKGFCTECDRLTCYIIRDKHIADSDWVVR